MSWDLFLFNSKQKISTIEELDDSILELTDFDSLIVRYFKEISINDNHCIIHGVDSSIEYNTDKCTVRTKLLTVYGENGLFDLVILAKQHNWQIYDTGNGKMIDLDNPGNNGYLNFQKYRDSLIRVKRL
ncbi:hypothetical protein [Flavihumibacter sp. UBA7668]|uniref:hypothetical protein n=1 Tax=Flavihumibacter sp. UBA7668 TaxID=1946542 RepID=UPI0025BBF4F5|nr:hypothetical protein [Flavihumibacter sp. UBA7668]